MAFSQKVNDIIVYVMHAVTVEIFVLYIFFFGILKLKYLLVIQTK